MTHDLDEGRRPDAPDHDHLAPPVIVVGLDGSPSGWDALSWALGEALRSHGTVVAVHAVPVVDMAAAFGVPYDFAGVDQARHEIADQLRVEAADRAAKLGVELSFVTERGDATHALAEVARGLRAHLVVVGRSTQLWHRITGSLSHRLTSRDDAPIVVVVP